MSTEDIILVKKICVGDHCTGKFSVMENDPQEWCSNQCEDYHGAKGWEKKKQSFLKIPRETKVVKERYGFPVRGEQKKESKKSVSKKEIEPEQKSIQKTGQTKKNSDEKILQQNNVKEKDNKKAITITQTKIKLTKLEPQEQTKIGSKQMKDNEIGINETKSNSSKKSEIVGTEITQQEGLPNLLQISEQVKLTSMNLIDDTAQHLYDSMKSMNNPNKGDKINIIENIESEIERIKSSCAIATEIRNLMSLKLDLIKTCHVINKDRR